jgi:uncharacterized protein (TIGR02147 family)
MPASDSPDVFRYDDYRKFLAEHYAHAKEHDYGFSFRVFSKRAGISSSNFLRLVIDGKRNLSPSMAPQFAAACGLKPAAADFFCELVAYNQAKTARERTRHYEQMRRFRPFRDVRQLDAQQAEYHSQWYLPAIRELTLRADFDEAPKWIAAQLEPAISTRQAKQALATLARLGLLERDAVGRLRQTSALVSTGPGPLGHHVVNFHHAMLERAAVALDHCPRDEREISALTVCVSQDKLLELKARLREFRRSLLELAELGDAPERVVQINFQLFPLSKRRSNSVVAAADQPIKATRVSRARSAKKSARVPAK